MSTEKLRKLLPNGLIVDKFDLIKIIEKQERLICDLKLEMASVNSKMTSKRHTEIINTMRACWK